MLVTSGVPGGVADREFCSGLHGSSRCLDFGGDKRVLALLPALLPSGFMAV